MADALTQILQAASKHPNSRVSKLIHTVQEDLTQKNIVLLLIELADHAEFSIDFNISLKYYLELFDYLGINSDLVLNEAGLLLLNSSKLYSKRVDYVQSLVERQILTLSNADQELQQQKLNQQESSTESATPVEKPKRGRKRALEVQSDPYEVELAPKKFKKLSEEKRFSVQKTTTKAKSIQRNIEMEQHIHPAGWMHATIYDLDNEEDVDTKRNYKLFTYHIEHRYNTLVPDINFRLHFKVKDYIDAQEEEMDADEACNTDRTWPPLSEAYIQKYLKLENYVLQQDLHITKRKTMAKEDDDGDEREIREELTNEDIREQPNDIFHENDLNVQHLNTSILNENKNDSALGQSLDATQLDMANTSALNNTIFDSSTTSNNLNNTIESDKSLNLTQTLQENDSALGTSLLDESNNTELNSSTEASGNLDTTNCNETAPDSSGDLSANSLNQTNKTELNSSTDASANLDATNCNETRAETNENLDASNCKEISSDNMDNITESTEIAIIECANTTLQMECQEKKEEENLEHTKDLRELKDNLDSNDIRKDLALSDKKLKISTQNLATMTLDSCNKTIENDQKFSDIDIIENNDKDHCQIRIQLPDDEGVCLSDLEEQDHCMLASSIQVTNILPGVQRKDVTIIMDEELRQALELRDGIMEHFGREKYYVPITTEPAKQNLYFNILKLPEKIIRRKVLFKLGPEMDLYLQARSFKRKRLDPQPRDYRTKRLLQWFSLNNTDMTGINMTPPNSPGHCSEFCGFTDNEDDDDISCSEFCGFNEKEQNTLEWKSLNRLSRDSGVGVDQLTPEKETLEVIFENESELAVDNSKKNLNFSETNECNNEPTDFILNQLSSDIREALTAELNDNAKDSTENCVNQIDNSVAKENDSQKLPTAFENLTNNKELTEAAISSELEQLESFTEDIEKLSSKNCTENLTENVEQSLETLLSSEEQQTVVPQESQEMTKSLEPNTDASQNTNIDVAMSSDRCINKANPNKTSENENCDENNSYLNDTCDDHHADANDDDADSEDEPILDLGTQGTKTKIQLWHEHLQPILAKSRERHHFDVFKLGTEIIETVQTNKQTEQETLSNSSPSSHPVALFHDIMDNKDKSYVSRYFLSTLLLANQSNVEISVNNKSSEHPSAWNDIQLKLLSTKRHTVAIEDNIGMINNNKKTTQKDNDKLIKTKRNKQSQIAVDDDEEDDEPLVEIAEASKNKTIITSCKRPSENTIFSIAEKKPKETTTTTKQKKNILWPNETSNSLITNVQMLPPLQITTTTNDNTSFSLPQLKDSVNMPCTSRQAQDLQAFEVNLNSIRMLQPIQKKLANQNIQKFYRKIKKLPVLASA